MNSQALFFIAFAAPVAANAEPHDLQTTYTVIAAASTISPTAQAIDASAGGPNDYSVTEITEMLTEPTTAAQLLRNLKLVWDKRLLTQPAFYADVNLLKCFGGAEIHWEKAHPFDANLRKWNGKVIVNNQLFHHLVVEIFRVQEQVEESKTMSGVLPRHEHDVGEIQFDIGVEDKSMISWGSVKDVFGSDAKDVGVDVILDGLTPPSLHVPDKALMRYLYPGVNPSKVSVTMLSFATFRIRQQPLTHPFVPGVSDRADDIDEVKQIAIHEATNR